MNSNLQDSIILITSIDSQNNRFGTGFVIYQDQSSTYLLTCNHVVKDVGGSDKVKAGNFIARVIASGEDDGIDLAVLQIEDLLVKPSLNLRVSGKKGNPFITAGFQLFGKAFLIRELQGNLGTQVGLEFREGANRIDAWDLKIVDEYNLQPGYSGSPVVEPKSGYVLGVVSHRQGDGEKGLAISIEALEMIWKEIPLNLLKGNALQNSEGETDNISSQFGLDYTPLRNLLAAGQWKEADRQTAAMMMKLEEDCNREALAIIHNAFIENIEEDLSREVRLEHIETVACQAIQTIDALWVKYSQGRFGFSVQQRIWQEVKESYQAFGDRVGWRVKGKLPFTRDWKSYSNVIFSLNAPQGHLPANIYGAGGFDFFGLDEGARGGVSWGDTKIDIVVSNSARDSSKLSGWGTRFSSLASRFANCNIQ